MRVKFLLGSVVPGSSCVILTAMTNLVLSKPVYLSVSKNQGGLDGNRVPILFGNDLFWNDLPYSKGFMKFRCLEPSKIMFDF